MRILTAHIEPEIQARDGFGAIRELLTRLVHAGAVLGDAEDSIYRALCMREKAMSTGVGARLAMPYAESPSLSAPVVAFGRSTIGIDFHAIDGLPVQFVLLCLTPPARSRDEQYPIAKLLHDCGGMLSHHKLQAIRRCSSAQEISAILNDDSD